MNPNNSLSLEYSIIIATLINPLSVRYFTSQPTPETKHNLNTVAEHTTEMHTLRNDQDKDTISLKSRFRM